MIWKRNDYISHVTISSMFIKIIFLAWHQFNSRFYLHRTFGRASQREPGCQALDRGPLHPTPPSLWSWWLCRGRQESGYRWTPGSRPSTAGTAPSLPWSAVACPASWPPSLPLVSAFSLPSAAASRLFDFASLPPPVKVWQCQCWIKSGAAGFNTGNGEKLSSGQAPSLAAAWLAAA